MPIKPKETDLYPDNLLETESGVDEQWWVLYTISRQEKQLMKKLLAREIAFYGPTYASRKRSPSGRVRTSYLPLFRSYVFLRGNEMDRHIAMKTNCLSTYLAVPDPEQLVRDLRQIYQTIVSGAALAPQDSLEPGDTIRVRSGPFQGVEGKLIHRQGHKALFQVELRFLNRGVLAEFDACDVEHH